MEEFKIYFKSKYFWIPFLLLMVIFTFNSYIYLQNALGEYSYYSSAHGHISYNTYINTNGYYNRFDFFRNLYEYNDTSDMMCFVYPLIIIYSGISIINEKLNTSILKGELLRVSYNKFITKEIVLSYIKGILPFLISFTIFIIIGSLTFSTNSIFNGKDNFISFFPNHYMDIIWYIFTIFVFDIILTNVSYIVMTKIKNIYGNAVISFIILIGLFYVVSIFTKDLSPFIFNDAQFSITKSIESALIFITVTFIPLVAIYWNKKNVLSIYE